MRKCDYCCYHISKGNKDCIECEYFEAEWKMRVAESQYSYCCAYEEKPMKDCKGAKFSNREGRYMCRLEGKYSNVREWSKCPYKTPNKYYEGD